MFGRREMVARRLVAAVVSCVSMVALPAGLTRAGASTPGPGYRIPPFGNSAVIAGHTGGASPLTTAEGPRGVAEGPDGQVYVADSDGAVIWGVAHDGSTQSPVAGLGPQGYSGDGGPADRAFTEDPNSVVVDAAGNVDFADSNTNRIRRVDHVTGVISTIAGTGESNGSPAGFGGDGGLAVDAHFSSPEALAIDQDGNLYVSDWYNDRIRRIDAVTGVVTTIAYGQNSPIANAGDGGSALDANFFPAPDAMASDGAGHLYLVFTGGNSVKRIDLASDIITTVAGTGTDGLSAAGAAAVQGEFDHPTGVTVAPDGSVLIADQFHLRIARLDPQTLAVSTAITLTDSSLASCVYADKAGDVFICEPSRVIRVDHATGRQAPFTGSGVYGFSGDGGRATLAQLDRGEHVSLDAAGNVFLGGNSGRIRRIDRRTGLITTFAGVGNVDPQGDYQGEGGPATQASLGKHLETTVDAVGNVYIDDFGNGAIRKVDAVTGIISTIAGVLGPYPAGDGGPAKGAVIGRIGGIAVTPAGDVFVADVRANEIRRIDHSSGLITRVAGNGAPSNPDPAASNGDGGAALQAAMTPGGVTADAAGNLYFVDTGAGRVRKVDLATGLVSTVAGMGVPANTTSVDSGDGGPATEAELDQPASVGVDDAGDVFIDTTHYVRRVDHATGVIETIAGDGSTRFHSISTAGIPGDGTSARSMQLLGTTGIAVDHDGNVFVPDGYARRVFVIGGEVNPLQLPDAADAPGVVAGPASVMVSWQHPNDGGTPIDSYKVTGTPTGSCTTTTATSCTVNGLTPGIPTTFTVAAHNRVGVGPESPPSVLVAANPVAGSPSAPRQLAAIPGDHTIRVVWNRPITSTTPISGYVVTAMPGQAQAIVGPALQQADLTGLTDGTTYAVTVRAVNAAGVGVSSNPAVSVTPQSANLDPNQKFAVAASVDFLRRLPNGGELASDTAWLDHGGSRGAVIDDLSTSPEWTGNFLNGLYQDTLGRDPDAAGLHYWQSQLTTGAQIPSQVAAAFYSSGEYYGVYGHNDPATWVSDLYRKILHRNADSAGLAYWATVAASQGRPAVATPMYQSIESRTDRVTTLYFELLGRAPDADGLLYWVDRLTDGNDLALAAQLAIYDEYFADAQRRF